MSDPTPSQPAAPADAPATPAPHSDHHWVWQVTALSLILGIMLALALRTTAHIRSAGLPDRGFNDLKEIRTQNAKLEQERNKLREAVAELGKQTATEKNSGDDLRLQLAEYRALTGYSGVKGEGVEVVLRDSPKGQNPLPGTELQDYLLDVNVDVKGIVNELWAAGAEAISITGRGGPTERFVVTSTVQADPQGARINGRVLAGPYTIRAIGNRKELRAALEMPEGIVAKRGLRELEMIVLKENQQLELPAYSHTRNAGSPGDRGDQTAANR